MVTLQLSQSAVMLHRNCQPKLLIIQDSQQCKVGPPCIKVLKTALLILSSGEHGVTSSTNSCGNGDILQYSNVNGQQSLSNNASYSNSIEMDVTPDGPFETAARAPKQARMSRFWFPERRAIFYRSTKHEGGWAHINVKKQNRLKKKVRARVIADCRVRQFDECRRDIEALAKNEFESIAKEHAAQLDSQRILAEKAIREAREDRTNLLKSIHSLEHAKNAVESEAKAKDQQIRDLKADLKKQSAIAERAVRKAGANSDYKSKVIMDLEAENAGLKQQIDNVKKDLKASVKVEDLKMALLEQPPRTEAKQQAQSIRTSTDSVDQLKSIIAEQAQTLMDFKNVNSTSMKELARQRSEKAILEDRMTRLREKLHAKRRMDENLVKHTVEESEASAETVPTAEVLTAVTIQGEPTLSESRTLGIPAVASAPTAFSIHNIIRTLILLAFCYLFGNLILSFGLVSLGIFSGTKIFFSASSNMFYTDLSAEEKTGSSAIGTDTEDRKIASLPGGWAWWEEH